MGIQNWVRRRVTLVAGQAQTYEPRVKSTNALYIINNNSADVLVGPGSDVANDPEATIKSNSNGPLPLSAPGETVYLYCASTVTITLVEITTDDLTLVFAMQVVVSDISSAVDVSDRAGRALGAISVTGSIPAGTNNIGDVDVLTLGGVTPLYDTGNMRIVVGEGGNLAQVRSFGAPAGSRTALVANAIQMSSYGSDVEVRRSNIEETALASAARTATAQSAVLTNYNGRGIQVALHASAKAAATTLTINLLVRDAVSGVYTTKASSTAFAAVAGTTYVVDFAPGVLDGDYGANGDGRNILVPRLYKVEVVPGDASEVTYGASVSTI